MSFEYRFGELLKDEDPYQAGPDPVPIIAAARRRRARRRVGAGAAAVAVALVCGVTAVTAGNARHVGQVAGDAMTPSARAVLPAATGVVTTPTATPTGLPLSPVHRVAPNEKVQLAPGVRVSVTPTEDCQDTVDRSTGVFGGAGCTKVPSAPDLPYDRPGISVAFDEATDRIVVHSYYRGPVPARIVLFAGDRPTVATLLVTTGMDGWVAYYADLPRDVSRTGPLPTVPAAGAYDAAGKLLAGSPGQAADGARVQPPAVL